MIKIALTGKNISYSKSPLLYSLLSKYFKDEIVCDLIDIEEDQLELTLDKIRNKEYLGTSVTIPYKEKVIKYLDSLTEKAKFVGAVNCVYLKEGKLIGDNTDIDGLEFLLNNNNISYHDKKIICLGTGGAAKSTKYVFRNDNLTFVTRNKDNYKGDFAKVISYQELNDNYDIYINCTPIGTNSTIDCPIDTNIIKDKITIDFVYKPKNTLFVTKSRLGISGVDILIGQGLSALNNYLDIKIKLSLNELNELREELTK
ncbi:MAG: hypothetical protein LBV58_00290 [Acholeplasmatales bacterium]|jgi:shikimate dehydrogenase|nr:hypothetical protein [Acholeplasmatales bacterium]